jgi:hypothetical protein
MIVETSRKLKYHNTIGELNKVVRRSVGHDSVRILVYVARCDQCVELSVSSKLDCAPAQSADVRSGRSDSVSNPGSRRNLEDDIHGVEFVFNKECSIRNDTEEKLSIT